MSPDADEVICGYVERGRPADPNIFLRRRHFPVGAEVISKGVHFRVWAPRSRSVVVEFGNADGFSPQTSSLDPEGDGYFSGHVDWAEDGMLYRFRIDTGLFPDPAARFQPNGPHDASQIVDPGKFPWTDSNWRGPSLTGQAIYELHIGTFTREGNWRAAMGQLPALKELGITIVELMPVADFCGRFGWGYDGVNMFAPTRLYGSPDEMRAFVDYSHALGIGVILDVVYNHFGPDGNYIGEFSKDYFSKKYKNEWGEALNFDADNSGPVREFFITNAAYWIKEFHLDGLRLDATQQIHDASPRHILTEIGEVVRAAGNGRATFIVNENERQHTALVRRPENGGNGLDALWNDDFHHSARVALTGKKEAYYTDYRGTPQELISAVKWGYLFQGQRYDWQTARRGTPALDLPPSHFVNFIQNHDQVANTMRGLRIHQLTTSGRLKAMTTLLLLAPQTPMLFMGQEFAASSPFLYFADHQRDLARLVRQGRFEFLKQFKSFANGGYEGGYDQPDCEETYRKCILDFSEREKHADIYALHCDLMKLRKNDPVFAQPRYRGLDGAVLAAEAFLLRFFGEGDERLLIVNLGTDLNLHPAPEPLLASPIGKRWRMVLSTESVRYGGSGSPPTEDDDGNWWLPGHAAVVLSAELSVNRERGDHGKIAPHD